MSVLSETGKYHQDVEYLCWDEIYAMVARMTEEIARDGMPSVIIGIQRGGLIPGVILSHLLGVRDLVVVDVRRTLSDAARSKRSAPVLVGQDRFEIAREDDILVVDDIAGTGATLFKLRELLASYEPRRLRFLSCLVNRAFWKTVNACEPESLIHYIGRDITNWAVFPWEKRDALGADGGDIEDAHPLV